MKQPVDRVSTTERFILQEWGTLGPSKEAQTSKEGPDEIPEDDPSSPIAEIGQHLTSSQKRMVGDHALYCAAVSQLLYTCDFVVEKPIFAQPQNEDRMPSGCMHIQLSAKIKTEEDAYWHSSIFSPSSTDSKVTDFNLGDLNMGSHRR